MRNIGVVEAPLLISVEIIYTSGDNRITPIRGSRENGSREGEVRRMALPEGSNSSVTYRRRRVRVSPPPPPPRRQKFPKGEGRGGSP